MLSRIKKNDTVHVISGKDKGKQGLVLNIDTCNQKVIVKDIGMVTKHVKARSYRERGGIIKEESFISLSKVMPVCSACKKPCRMVVKQNSDQRKVRSCHRCREIY